MKYEGKTQRVIRIIFGLGLLVYLFTDEKFPYWLPFYTFHTNLFVAFWYILAGAFPHNGKPSFWLHTSVKGAITAYITITGLIYNTLLIPVERAYRGYIPFASIVTHIFVPLIMILDYLLAPVVDKPDWRRLWLWLSYPLLYAAGVIVGGSISGNYPYPFIDPQQVGSILQLIINYAALILLHLGLAALYLAIGRYKYKRQQDQI